MSHLFYERRRLLIVGIMRHRIRLQMRRLVGINVILQLVLHALISLVSADRYHGVSCRNETKS